MAIIPNYIGVQSRAIIDVKLFMYMCPLCIIKPFNDCHESFGNTKQKTPHILEGEFTSRNVFVLFTIFKIPGLYRIKFTILRLS